MAYGELKVDSITFTNGGTDTTVSVSGLVQNPTFSGDITVTGTISGDVILGGTTVSGATVTGSAGEFGTVTGNTAGFTTITGTSITGSAGQFGTVTGNTAGFTTVTGTTVTGTTANFVTVSGTTVTGDAAEFTSITGGTAGFTTVTGTTVTGTTANFNTVSGTTVTGGTGNFTSISATTTTITSGVFASGTAAAPSVSVGTTDNGLYSPGTDQVAISTNGTGRLFVDASGQVSISSQNSATIPLRIYSSSNAGDAIEFVGRSTNGKNQLQFYSANGTTDQFQITSTDNSVGFATQLNTYIAFLTNSTEKLRITSDGKLGLGTSSPNAPFDIVHDVSNSTYFRAGGTQSERQLIFSTEATAGGLNNHRHTINANSTFGELLFKTNSTNALFISNTQQVGIGTTSPGSLLHLADAGDITVGTTTGTKIGTATSQKIGFYNATPVVQPTTGVAEAAFVENSGGTAVNVDSTFGGYTIQQVVEALQTLGLLA